MNKFFPLFLIVTLFLISCGSNDSNPDPNIELVENEFRSYVQKNFDDPASLKEIVEIHACDTISLSKMRDMTDLTVNIISTAQNYFQGIDSLILKRQEEEMSTMNRNPGYRPSRSESLEATQYALRLMTLTDEISKDKLSLIAERLSMEEMSTKLNYHPALYIYEIRYRNQYREGLKLESAFAYIDSLTGLKSIQLDRQDFQLMPSEYNDLSKQIQKCVKLTDQIKDNYDQLDTVYDEFDKFLMRTNL